MIPLALEPASSSTALDPVWTVRLCGALAAVLVVGPLLERWARPPRRPAPAAASPSASRRRRTCALRARRPTRRPHRRRPTRRARPTPPADVARWLDDIAAELRLGRGLTEALGGCRPPGLRTRLEPLHRLLDHGASTSDAIHRWRLTIDEDDDSLMATATVLGAIDDVGGPQAPPVERTAALLRARAAEGAERAAWASPAHLSAQVLTALPLIVLGLLLMTDAEVRAVIGTPSGSAVIGAGLVLDAAGLAWMRRVIRRSTS